MPHPLGRACAAPAGDIDRASVVSLALPADDDKAYGLALNLLPAACLSLDPGGRLTDVNRNWELLFGLHASKVRGMNFVNLLNGASRPEFEFAFAETRIRGSFAGPVLTARNKTSDELVSFRIYFMADRNHDGQVSQTHCVLIKLDQVTSAPVVS